MMDISLVGKVCVHINFFRNYLRVCKVVVFFSASCLFVDLFVYVDCGTWGFNSRISCRSLSRYPVFQMLIEANETH